MATLQPTTTPNKCVTHDAMKHNQAYLAWSKFKYLLVAALVLVVVFVTTSVKFAFAQSAASTATIRGAVFYNDQRTHGLFSERWNRDGNRGMQCKYTGIAPDCSASEQRLAELRKDREEQIKAIKLIQHPPALKRAQEHLTYLDEQIAAEEIKLAECQKTCGLNWLAGKYMVVDVIERDEGFFLADTNCHTEEPLTSATVADDGSFTATFSTNDPCNHDKLSHAAIELRVRLKYCNSPSYCFSINASKNTPYTLSHSHASASNPMIVKAGDDIMMSTIYFNTETDPADPNNYSIAANYYASIVDTILTLHEDSTIPFYMEEFGEIQYIFPSTKSSSATARSPTEVAISNYDSQPEELGGRFAWVDGKTPAHEYGHIMMQRAWDGAYGFDGVGTTAKDYKKAPDPSAQIAFKEAWAEFITRVVFQPTRGCGRSSFDYNGHLKDDCSIIEQRLAQLRIDRNKKLQDIADTPLGKDYAKAQAALVSIDAEIAAAEKNLAECRALGIKLDYSNSKTNPNNDTSGNLKGPLGEGAQWRDNVTKALCDWYDATDDDDQILAGAGDHFTVEDIYSVWYNLRYMYVDADKYGGEFKNPGLWFCDYVQYYLDVRKSASAVGQSAHDSYENSIRDLIYNNNIGCNMVAPK